MQLPDRSKQRRYPWSNRLLCYVSVPQSFATTKKWSETPQAVYHNQWGGRCVYVCVTVAQAAVFTVHLFVPNNTQRPNTEKETQYVLAFCFYSHYGLLESLWPAVFVFSNQQQTDDNIWFLAVAGHFQECVRTFLEKGAHVVSPIQGLHMLA